MQVHLSRNYIFMVILSLNYTSPSSTVATFSQHASWWWCIYLGILSSMTEILLTNLVFYGGVTFVSVSTLKSSLSIIGAILLKPQISPIIGIYI